MQIRYVANGMIRRVREGIARTLIRRGLAREVPQPQPEPVAPAVDLTYETRELRAEDEISPRTGKPKRRYRRRDLGADES